MLRSDTENYHHAHEFADAWASVEVGAAAREHVWGYGHSNVNIDLREIDPDVVEVFGLDDPRRRSRAAVLRRATSRNRAEYNRAWDEVKAAAG